jgi:hypothetical protein
MAAIRGRSEFSFPDIFSAGFNIAVDDITLQVKVEATLPILRYYQVVIVHPLHLTLAPFPEEFAAPLVDDTGIAALARGSKGDCHAVAKRHGQDKAGPDEGPAGPGHISVLDRVAAPVGVDGVHGGAVGKVSRQPELRADGQLLIPVNETPFPAGPDTAEPLFESPPPDPAVFRLYNELPSFIDNAPFSPILDNRLAVFEIITEIEPCR